MGIMCGNRPNYKSGREEPLIFLSTPPSRHAFRSVQASRKEKVFVEELVE